MRLITVASETFMAQMDAIAAKCGYTDYLAQHLTFPPQGLLPLPNNRTRAIGGCGLWDTIFDAALVVNPAFNVYRIFDTVSINAAQIVHTLNTHGQFPILWDVLGFP